MAGDQEQEDAGKKLCQSDIAKVDGAAGDLVDLPANGHGLRLSADDREQAGELEEPEISMLECSTWRHKGRLGHAINLHGLAARSIA